MTAATSPTRQLAASLADVVIGIREDVSISRHLLRGVPSYVIRDPITFQSHSLSVEDYQVYMALDNARTLGDIYQELVQREVLTTDQEETFYRFIVSLNQRGLLNLPISNAKSLFQRFAARRRQQARQRWLSIFCFRLPLFRPDRFLDATIEYVRFLFSTWFYYLWLILVGLSLFGLAQRWSDFQSPLGSMLALQNVPLTLALIVILKVWHELGHAYACKHLGGNVPEMGALFIVGTPCAYVDASAAWGFSRRRDRILVNVAGMYFESLVAILALAVWNFTQPSLIHSFAHRTVVVSTVITFFFNLNPLMRYDGYYVVSDALNIPNLRQVSVGAVRSLAQRWFLGLDSPVTGQSTWSRAGFVLFGSASAVYKVMVVMGICVVICFRFPLLGLTAGLAYAGSMLVGNLYRMSQYLLTSPETQPVRRRAVTLFAAVVVGLPAAALLIPVSRSVTLDGVMEREHEHVLRAATDGFLQSVHVASGDRVDAQDVVCELENPTTRINLIRSQVNLERLQIDLQSLLSTNRELAMERVREIEQAQQELHRVVEDIDALVVRSPTPGVITQSSFDNERGKFYRRGEPLLRVSRGEWVVRAVASAEQLVDALPKDGLAAEVQLLGKEGTVRAYVQQVAPAGSRRIDRPVLTHLAGGQIAVRSENMEAEQPFFDLMLTIDDADVERLHHGMRVVVRLPESPRSVGRHLYRRGLQFYNRYLRG